MAEIPSLTKDEIEIEEILKKKEKIKEEKLMIDAWLEENEVEILKDFKPSGKSGQKRAKNKNFVSDKEFSTGERKGSTI